MRTIGPRHDALGHAAIERALEGVHVGWKQILMFLSDVMWPWNRLQHKLCNIRHLRIRASDGFRVSQVLIQKPSSQRFSQVQLGQQRVTSFVCGINSIASAGLAAARRWSLYVGVAVLFFCPFCEVRDLVQRKTSENWKVLRKVHSLSICSCVPLLGSDEDEHLRNWGVEPLLKSNLSKVSRYCFGGAGRVWFVTGWFNCPLIFDSWSVV